MFITTENASLKAPQSDNSKRTFIVKVTGKERVDGQYLVYTDEGTFKIEDSLIFGRFDSSDVLWHVKERQVLSYQGVRHSQRLFVFLPEYR